MKKILALILAGCIMLSALPVFASSAETETGFSLEGVFENVLNEENSTEGKTVKLLRLFSVLKEKLAGKTEAFSVIVSSLIDKLLSKIDDGGIITTLLSLLKSKLAGGSDTGRSMGGESGGIGDLGGLLSGLLGGDGETSELSGLTDLLGGLLSDSGTESDNAEWTEEDEAELQTVLDEINEKAKNETGDRVPNKKEVESIEEFFGNWNCIRFSFDGNEYDMTDSGVGVFIGKDTCYITENGGISPDNTYAETVEMILENNVLKIISDGRWEAFVLTQDGELVDLGSSILFYYVPASQSAQPVTAEEPEKSASSSQGKEILGELVSGLLGNNDELGGLGDLVGGLMNSSESGNTDLSGLKDLVGGLLGGEGENSGPDMSGIGSLLSGLLSGSETREDAWTEEDTEDLQATIDRINEQALNETGEGIANKKEAEKKEEFFGTWICTKMVIMGETFDMTEDDDPLGMVIGENEFYYFDNEGNDRPEDLEMLLENGVLKIKTNGTWSAFVLTEDEELINTGNSVQTYYIRSK